jgi:hypothetical protein
LLQPFPSCFNGLQSRPADPCDTTATKNWRVEPATRVEIFAAAVRVAQAIACDIHMLNNLIVLQYLGARAGGTFASPSPG